MQWQIEYACTTHQSTVEQASRILIQPHRCKEAHRFVDATANTPNTVDSLAKDPLEILCAIGSLLKLVHPQLPGACLLLNIMRRLAGVVARIHRPARQLRENAVLHFFMIEEVVETGGGQQ